MKKFEEMSNKELEEQIDYNERKIHEIEFVSKICSFIIIALIGFLVTF